MSEFVVCSLSLSVCTCLLWTGYVNVFGDVFVPILVVYGTNFVLESDINKHRRYSTAYICMPIRIGTVLEIQSIQVGTKQALLQSEFYVYEIISDALGCGVKF